LGIQLRPKIVAQPVGRPNVSVQELRAGRPGLLTQEPQNRGEGQASVNSFGNIFADETLMKAGGVDRIDRRARFLGVTFSRELGRSR
jgi:hypothetical protein